MSTSVRDLLIAELKRYAGELVHVIGVEDSTDALDRRAIVVKQRTMKRLAEAPNAALRIDYVLTFTSPAIDPAKAEPELDQWVPEVLDDMRASKLFMWTEATKVTDGQNLSYDVDAYVITTPRNDPKG